MFRKTDINKISDDDFANIVNPHINEFNDYLESNIIPVAIAHYLSSGYSINALWSEPFENHINDVLNKFNVEIQNIILLKHRITQILENKYNLKVTNENPLDFIGIKKWPSFDGLFY